VFDVSRYPSTTQATTEKLIEGMEINAELPLFLREQSAAVTCGDDCALLGGVSSKYSAAVTARWFSRENFATASIQAHDSEWVVRWYSENASGKTPNTTHAAHRHSLTILVTIQNADNAPRWWSLYPARAIHFTSPEAFTTFWLTIIVAGAVLRELLSGRASFGMGAS
jgi:hypothetical protein